MVVIVKKKRTSRRPGLLQPTDSVSSMRSTTERSLSSSSLKKNGNNDWNGAPFKAPAVSFAQDYGYPDTVHPPPEPLGDEEIKESFYNVS